MQIDQTSLTDLSIFSQEETGSVFSKLNFTRTSAGSAWLHKRFSEPLASREAIYDQQSIVQMVIDRISEWPENISNGTLLVVEKFLDYPLDPMPSRAGRMNSLLYKFFHNPDFALARYSIIHIKDLFQGMAKLCLLLSKTDKSNELVQIITDVQRLLKHPEVNSLLQHQRDSFSHAETIRYAGFFHQHYKRQILALIDYYGKMDAWYSMAKAMVTYQLGFPVFIEKDEPFIEANGLFHILLDKPVPYELRMDPHENFIFLTGANMAGKSTFIKAVGICVYMAHLGMGVPARSMQLSTFEGILSNINVSDNIVKGESYFFNEVQRIRHTIITINNGRKWLVLIDEMFKGTNMQDAMKCSIAVIRGLSQLRNVLYILSTHLYEIGEELKIFPNICFRHFQTNIHNEQLEFSYQLMDGISKDRFGYLILKREKVIDMLDNLNKQSMTDGSC